MQDLQVVNNAESATYQQLTQQHIITMPLYQFDFVYGPSPDRSAALPYGRPGAPCPSPRQASKPAQCAARCGFCKIWRDPYQGTAGCTNIWEPPGAVVPGVCPIAPPTLTTLDLLGVSPIVSGIAQLLTACLAAALWAVAIADWLTADQRRQVQILRIAGHSQAAIGRRLGLTPYHVRRLLK